MPHRHVLRDRRLQRGLTQAELADRAGVSRQLVAAVEAGRNTPAVDAALGLARALGATVEELFGRDAAGVTSVVQDGLPDGVPVRVGRVGDRLVAAELPDHGIAGAGWATADGVLDGTQVRLFRGVRPAGCVVAGCDPALGIAESMLSGLGSRSLLAVSAPTGTALRALERDAIHAAVAHGRPGELPDPPVPVVRWHLARWQTGLAVPDRLRGHSLEAVLRSGVPIIQRDPAAASQQAFERARRAAGAPEPAPGPRASGHLDAARLAATLSGAAVTNESAASAFGLSLIALEEHIVEVWIAERWRSHPGIDALGEVLTTTAFSGRVAHLGGYDLAGCGESVAAA